MLIVTADSPFEISMLGAACDVVGYVDAGRGGGGEVILSCVHIAHAHGSATLPTALGTPPLPVSCWDGGWDDVDEVAMYELSNAAVAALTGGGDVHHSLALMLLVSLCSVTVDPVRPPPPAWDADGIVAGPVSPPSSFHHIITTIHHHTHC
jgi:hypothetical protein